MTRAARGILVLAALAFSTAPAHGEEAEFFILWGLVGRWDGTLEVEHGRLIKVEPFSFETQYGDEWQGADERSASWRSGVGGAVDGIHVWADVGPGTVFHLRTRAGQRDLKWSDFHSDRDVRMSIKGSRQFLILGKGTPDRRPKLPRSIPLPALFRTPKPEKPIAVPDDYWKRDEPIVVTLDKAPNGDVLARRVSLGDGRLGIQIYSTKGKASRWLSLTPRIGTAKIRVTWPGSEATLTCPTTLVEVRGTKLYVNGEPFLVKGTLPRDLNDADAEYLKSLCANTIRNRTSNLAYLDKYGFMGIIMVGRGPGKLCMKAKNAEEFEELMAKYLDGYEERARQTVKNPRTLIVQHANEQVMGLDQWTGAFLRHAFERLDVLLARCHNIAKPLDPMLPGGYSNCAFRYRTPDFMDVYLHNTYLDRDRNWPPIEEFMAFQGCDKRPYVHTEFGANVYMPQACVGGTNLPVLEKIHAGNYPNRWRTYLAAGTIGGTNYCFYDYDYGKFERIRKKTPERLKDFWDKGFTNFGVMTFDRKPKLACWELWHLWRDFEVTPEVDGGLRVRYCRDYWARNCRLTIDSESRPLDDFRPNSERSIRWSNLPKTFRWRMEYTTHAGLGMVACGAHPPRVEAEDFLARLEGREGLPLLKELLDADVLTADGRRVGTLKEMERDDGVVAVVFRKPNGVSYVTVFTRKGKGQYAEGVDVDLACRGRVERVDEMTGRPTGEAVEVEPLPKGLRLKGLRVPRIPASYGQRAREPIELPVYRISPE